MELNNTSIEREVLSNSPPGTVRASPELVVRIGEGPLRQGACHSLSFRQSQQFAAGVETLEFVIAGEVVS